MPSITLYPVSDPVVQQIGSVGQPATLQLNDVSPPYSDNFTGYNNGTLAGQGNWIAVRNVFQVQNGIVAANAAGLDCLLAYNLAVSNDQYSKIKINSIGSSYIGVGVRLSGNGATSNGYYYTATSSFRGVSKRVNNAGTAIASIGVGVNIGDELKIEVKGNVITCYLNGVIDTALSGGGVYVDNDLASGYAGLAGTGNAGDSNTKLWQGGDSVLSIKLFPVVDKEPSTIQTLVTLSVLLQTVVDDTPPPPDNVVPSIDIICFAGEPDSAGQVDIVVRPVDYTEANTNTNLVVQESNHAITNDSIVLTVVGDITLIVSESFHEVTNDTIALTQVHILTVQESFHVVTNDGIVLVQNHILVVAETRHLINTDGIVLGVGTITLIVAKAP